MYNTMMEAVRACARARARVCVCVCVCVCLPLVKFYVLQIHLRQSTMPVLVVSDFGWSPVAAIYVGVGIVVMAVGGRIDPQRAIAEARAKAAAFVAQRCVLLCYHIWSHACLVVCLPVYLSVCLFVSVCVSACFFICQCLTVH